MTERELVKAAEKLVAHLGGWAFKTHGHLGQRRGIPDLLACLRGRLVAIECKGPRGRATPEQLRELARIRAAGGIAGVVRSIDELIALVKQAVPELEVMGYSGDDRPGGTVTTTRIAELTVESVKLGDLAGLAAKIEALVDDVRTKVHVWLKRGAGRTPAEAYATALQELVRGLALHGVVSPRAAEELLQALRDYAAACAPPPTTRR